MGVEGHSLQHSLLCSRVQTGANPIHPWGSRLGARRALSVSSPGMAVVPTGTAHLQALCWELQSWEQRPGPQRVREATVLPSQ